VTQASHQRRVVFIAAAAVVLVAAITVLLFRLKLEPIQTNFNEAAVLVTRFGSPVANTHITVITGNTQREVVTDARGRANVDITEPNALQLEAKAFFSSASVPLVRRNFREEARCTAKVPNYFLIDLRCERVRSQRAWPPTPERYSRVSEEPLTGAVNVEIGTLHRTVETTNGIASMTLTRDDAHQLVRSSTMQVRLGDMASDVALKVVPLKGEVSIADRTFASSRARVIVQNGTLDCVEVRVRAGYTENGRSWASCFLNSCVAEQTLTMLPGQESIAMMAFRGPFDLDFAPERYGQHAAVMSSVQRPCG